MSPGPQSNIGQLEKKPGPLLFLRPTYLYLCPPRRVIWPTHIQFLLPPSLVNIQPRGDRTGGPGWRISRVPTRWIAEREREPSHPPANSPSAASLARPVSLGAVRTGRVTRVAGGKRPALLPQSRHVSAAAHGGLLTPTNDKQASFVRAGA